MKERKTEKKTKDGKIRKIKKQHVERKECWAKRSRDKERKIKEKIRNKKEMKAETKEIINIARMNEKRKVWNKAKENRLTNEDIKDKNISREKDEGSI